MRLLILGPNGQLGSDLLKLAKMHGGENLTVYSLGREELDVADPAAVETVLGRCDFDALVNCTSYHKTDEVEGNATRAFAVNAHAVSAMAKSCRTRGAKFLHISTDYVFNGDAVRPYVETDIPGPINVYGASKVMGENLAMTNYREGTYILRVASLFGIAGASGKGGNFVETMIRVGQQTGKLKVVGDIIMSPTATADVASMTLGLLGKHAPPGIYHAVNSGHASWYEFACQIIKRTGVDADVTAISSSEFPAAAQRPFYSVLDNAKISALLGPVPSWTEALDRYLVAKGHVTAADGQVRVVTQ